MEKPALVEIWESVFSKGVFPKYYEPMIEELMGQAIVWRVNYGNPDTKVVLCDAQVAYYEQYKKINSGSIFSRLLWRLLYCVFERSDFEGSKHSIQEVEKIRRKLMPEQKLR